MTSTTYTIISSITDFPIADVVANPRIYKRNGTLLVGYYSKNAMFTAINFPLAYYLGFGGPGLENLPLHPLFEFGLNHRGQFEASNSPKLIELKKYVEKGRDPIADNEISLQIARELKHVIFTFDDETLEIIYFQDNLSKPKVSVVVEALANETWQVMLGELG